jgi:cytochrome c oxidase assembly protein subunit 15
MVATFVGFLTTVLAVWIARKEERAWVRILGFIALAAVITQGVLGGLTVLFLLPTPVSVAHATLAQSFFSLTIVIALVTSRGWHESTPVLRNSHRTVRSAAFLATSAVWVQLVLGAWMRHSAAGLAIPDFPLSYGMFLPPSGANAESVINSLRLQMYDLGPVTPAQVWIHFAHRAWAFVTCVLVFRVGLAIVRSTDFDRRLREPALVLMCLVLFQLLLGALTVWTGKGVQIATAHVATGALLLGTSVFLTLRISSLLGTPSVEAVPSSPSLPAGS